jgi:hypothetical protein
LFNSGVSFLILHQRIHFILGPIPVLDRKGVEREILDAKFAGDLDDGARGLGTLAVALDTGQVTLLRPPTVAVHDDGNVLGQGGLGFGI